MTPVSKTEWEENIKLALEESEQKKTVLDSMPPSIIVELNNICNYKCYFCNNRNDHTNHRLTLNQIDRLSGIIRYAASIFIGFSAEPFSTPKENSYLLNLIRQINPFTSIIIISNGYFLTEKTTLELVEKRVDRMKVSLHGHDRLSYFETSRQDAFDRVVSNMKFFASHKSLSSKLVTNTVLTDHVNLLDFLDLAAEIGVDETWFTFSVEYGRKANTWPTNGWTDELTDTLLKAFERGKELGIDCRLWYWGEEFTMPDEIENLRNYRANSVEYYNSQPNTCPFNSPWLRLGTRMTDVMHCQCSSVVVDNWEKKEWKDIWNGEYFVNLREQISREEFPIICDCKKLPHKKLKEGQVAIQPGDTLYSLFGDQWGEIYDLDSNKDFRSLNKNPNAILPGCIINTK